MTNSEQVLLGLERPRFQEVGPFMYKQWRRREVIDFEDNNRKLRFKEFKTFYSMYESSNLADKEPESDKTIPITKTSASLSKKSNHFDSTGDVHNISDNSMPQKQQATMLDPNNTLVTIVNLPLLSVLTKLAQLEEGSFKRNLAAKIASRLIKDGNDKILVTRPANQLLFDGYKVDFMESVRDLVSETLGYNFESPLPKNMFGFFYMKNGTWSRRDNGEITIFTGRNESMNDFMMVDNWNDLRQLNVWPTNTEAGNRCNQINGTDGSQFHPGANKNQVLSIFSPMICTSITIKYKEDTQAKGIPLLRFTTPADIFAAPKKNPKNACYCTIPNKQKAASQSKSSTKSSQQINDSRCYLDGIMDLSLCQRGAPIAASSPHFYNADPMLAMAAGLKPNKDLHETYLDIEPMTGSVFRAASRAQMNAFVEQAALEVVDRSIIGHMSPMVAPLLWLEESVEIDEKSSNEFKSQLLNLVQKAKRTFIYSIVVGCVTAIVVCIQYWYVTCYSIDTDLLKLASDRKRRPKNQYRENVRLGYGARRSNIAAKDGAVLLETTESNVAAPVIAMAAVLGVGGGTGRGQSRGDKRRIARRAVGYTGSDNNEDELSKRILVQDEWEVGRATNTSSSGRSSQGALSKLDETGEPASSQDELTEGPARETEDEIDLMQPGTSRAGLD